jgi:hypothetical protein
MSSAPFWMCSLTKVRVVTGILRTLIIKSAPVISSKKGMVVTGKSGKIEPLRVSEESA